MRPRWIHVLAIFGVAPALAACNGRLDVGSNSTGGQGGPGDDASFVPDGLGSVGPIGEGVESGTFACDAIEQLSLPIRNTNCALCHSGQSVASSMGGFGDVLDDLAMEKDRSNLVFDSNGLGLRILIPGDPDHSRLYLMVANGSMPPPGYPPLSVSDISILRTWVNCLAGSPNPPSDAGGSLPISDTPDAIAVDPIPDSGIGDATADPPDAYVVTPDASTTIPDASPVYVTVDASAPPGLAGFAFVLDGVVQTPTQCPSDNWEYWPVDGMGSALCGSIDSAMGPGCPIATAVLVNIGETQLPYYFAPSWSDPGNRPGVATGDPTEVVGVLDVGGQVDFTRAFNGGTVGLLGSALPFSDPDAGKYASDEGTVPWPAGVAGSRGSATMNIAEIELRATCGLASRFW